MNKRQKSNSFRSCNLVQSNIFTSINNLKKLSTRQKQMKNAKNVISPVIFELDDSDTEIESESQFKLVSPLKRKLALQFSDDEDDDNEISKGLHDQASQESNSTLDTMCIRKPNLRITSPMANSTPISYSLPRESNYISDMPFSKDLNCDTFSESEFMNSTDSDETVIYGNTIPQTNESSINIIDQYIIPPIIPNYNDNNKIPKRISEYIKSPMKPNTEQNILQQRENKYTTNTSATKANLSDRKENETGYDVSICLDNDSQVASETADDFDYSVQYGIETNTILKKIDVPSILKQNPISNDFNNESKLRNGIKSSITNSETNIECSDGPHLNADSRKNNSKKGVPEKLYQEIMEKKHSSIMPPLSNTNSSTRKKNTCTSVVKSPSKSPTKMKNENSTSDIVKRERRTANMNYLVEITDLFKSVFETTSLKDILIPEKEVFRLFFYMDKKWQYTCLKLITWKHDWYNIFKFCKLIHLEIEDYEICHMYKYLKEKRLVNTDYAKEDLLQLLTTLNNNDLKYLCKTLMKKTTLKNKEQMINYLMTYSTTQSTLTLQKSSSDILKDAIIQRMGKCVKLNTTFYDAFHRSFVLGTFTNIAFSTVTDYFNCAFHLKHTFPDYAIKDYQIFYTREEFIRYARAKRCREELEKFACAKHKNYLEILQLCQLMFKELQEIKDVEIEMENRLKNVPHLLRYTSKYVYASALTSSIKILKTRYPQHVKNWLEHMISHVKFSPKLGDWYDELCWLHMKYLESIDYQHAATLIIGVLQEEKQHLAEAQLYKLRHRAEQLKMGKKYKISQMHHDTIAELLPNPMKEEITTVTVDAKTIRGNASGMKRNYVLQDKEGNKNYLTVENRALIHYVQYHGYTEGRHCEGTLIMATFALFFWDIIYNPKEIVTGTFISKIQYVPLDMFTKYFYLNRKDVIDKRLKDIESEWSDAETITFVKENLHLHSHKTSLCEIENYIKDPELLETLVNCIGRRILSKIYERLVKDIGQYRSGMPDLLVWNMDNKKSKFIEVKGENDKLSIKQQLWLNYLNSIGAKAELCIVHSTGSKRKKTEKLKDTN